jgi:CopG family transcriptional regulator/antitoxin EndoAI
MHSESLARIRIISMSKRVNIMLPDATVNVLDRVAPKGDRSRFISQAVLHYVDTLSRANLRERLKLGALASARLDLEIAEEWFPVEQEAWQRLEKEEQAKKPTRSAGKSTSRRSTRR